MILEKIKKLSNRLNIKAALNLVTAATLLLISQFSIAQTVEPMIFELEPLGARSTESLRIQNPGSGPITVEVTAMKLVLDELGNETNTPADDDFLIYPPQTIVQADSTQVVKVKYVGDPTIQTSQAYRIVINQLPVDLKTSDASGLSILTKFLTVANVSPPKTRPDLKITDIEAYQDKEWLLTVENTGNRFGALSDTSWEIENTADTTKKKSLNIEQVNGIISRSLVLPNSKLRFKIPAIEGFDASTVRIKIKSAS